MLSSLLLLTACTSRPLTPAEVDLVAGIHGPSLNVAPVRITDAPVVGMTVREFPRRPRTTCRERMLPVDDAPTFQARTAGVVIEETAYMRPEYALPDYAADTAAGAPSLPAIMFFVHEMTHVWQWQNRAVTGYSPARAATEHVGPQDPYLFDDASGRRFLDYPFEQQASLVEEYLCCAIVDPGGARTARLRALVGQALPLTRVPDAAALPWDRPADLDGACR
ncbi:MAG: hypothetical protein ACU0BF_10115 [Paracoccaceae bacterium]